MSFRIDLKVFFFILIFYLTKQIEIYSYMMLFAFIHELGHFFAGVVLGFKTESINLTPLGFSIKFKIAEQEYNKKVRRSSYLELKKIIIALAGPITNLIIICLCVVLDINFYNKETIIFSNLLIAIFNLLPIYPLDGGRIIKNIFTLCFGREKAYTYIINLSNLMMFVFTFIGSILVYYFKSIAIFLIIVFLWGIVLNENRYLKALTSNQ